MLLFGYTSDKWSRKNSLLVSTICLALFTALAAGSYGYKGSIQGMFAALTAWRFLVGVVRLSFHILFERTIPCRSICVMLQPLGRLNISRLHQK